jgi:putative hydrolase
MITMDMHLHSNFSDGDNTPEEMVIEAIKLGHREIAITDHVRRLSHWLDEFYQEMERLKQLYSDRIRLRSGIEAKVINLEGAIDARPEFFSKVDLVLAACHRIPAGEDKYLTQAEILKDRGKALEYWLRAMTKVLENSNVSVIAHPTLILRRNGITLPYDLKISIAWKAKEYEKIIEVNTKYAVPDDEFIGLLKRYNVKLFYGSDSHNIEEMRAAVLAGGVTV